MLGVGFTFMELLARMRAKNPRAFAFESEAEALQKMIDKANELKVKPVDHVQQWSRDQE